ncbi:MAG: YncE family protein [Thermoplasmata archaeon]|nr:YncE family protein [Thermoplasmata archaeon]
MLNTLDLASNQLLPGTTPPALLGSGAYAVFNPVTDQLLVRGDLGTDISAVNLSTGRVVADIPAPVSQHIQVGVPSIVADPATGVVYAANANAANVTVIDGTTDLTTGSVSVGGSPYGIALDPSTHQVYVADYGASNVTGFTEASLRTTANISVGSHPAAILFDPASGQLFTGNFGSSNVSIIDAATNSLVATVAVGANPIDLALDTVDDRVAVLSESGGAATVAVINAGNDTLRTTIHVGGAGSSLAYVASSDRLYVPVGSAYNVTVIALANDTIVGSVPTGQATVANSIAYDPTDGDLYVACGGSGNITVFSATTDRTVANITTNNLPTGSFVDPATGTAYILNAGSYLYAVNLTVIHSGTHQVLGSIPLSVSPSGITYEPNLGELFTANSAGNDTYAIEGATGHVVAVDPVGPTPTVLPTGVVFDSVTGHLYTVNPSLYSVTASTSAGVVLANIPVGLQPIALSAAGGSVYVVKDINGNLSEINTTSNTVVGSVLVGAGHNLRSVFADPDNGEVYVGDWNTDNVTVYGAKNLTLLANIHVGTYPSSFAYDPANQTLFAANSGSGNVSVLSTQTNRLVATFSLFAASQLVYDSGSNAIYNAMQYDSDVNAVNASSYLPLAGSPLQLAIGSAAVDIAYDPVEQEVFVTSTSGGSVSVIGTLTNYPVTFEESGLANGTSWSITLQSSTAPSTTASIVFEEPNGNYSFTVGAVAGYTANLSSGTVAVHFGPRIIPISFTAGAGTYAVTFTQVGLPFGKNWSVTLGGSTRSSSTTTIGFSEPNSSYPFSVGTVVGYRSSPQNGSVTVAGAAQSRTIDFTANSAALSVALSAAPPQLVLGNETNLSATVSGGVAPFTLQYSGLPGGCTSHNVSPLPCLSTTAGTFLVRVNVTDHASGIASGYATLIVFPRNASPTHNSGGNTSSGFNSTELLLLLVVLLVAVILIVAWWRRRKRPADPATGTGSSAPMSAPVPTPGPAAPPPGAS